MSAQYTPRLSWEAAFLNALAKSKLIKRSAQIAGITTGAVYGLRERSAAFDREVTRVLQCDNNSRRALAVRGFGAMALKRLCMKKSSYIRSALVTSVHLISCGNQPRRSTLCLSTF